MLLLDIHSDTSMIILMIVGAVVAFLGLRDTMRDWRKDFDDE